MSTGLINIIKQASMDAVNNAQMSDLRFGTVTSAAPLTVQVTNQFTLPQSLLIVPKHLTNYTVDCTIQRKAETLSGEAKVNLDLKDEEDPIATHTHDVEVSVPSSSIRTTITIHNALTVGDKVALLRKQGGQSYFILDRI